MDVKGRVAVVTGGAGGLGRGIGQKLAQHGAHVLAADVARDTPEQIAAWCADWVDQSAASRIEGVVLDVTDAEAGVALAEHCLERFGHVDILVNNAGLAGPTAPVWETDIDLWHRHIAVMLTGPFLMTRAFVPAMLRHDYGRIVNIASIAGKEGNANTAPYSAAKAGVLGLTKTVGKELAQTGVLVNAIAPAVVESPMNHGVPEEFHRLALSKIPMGRPGRPEELAELVLFLASERLGFSTGAVFDFSGGRATY